VLQHLTKGKNDFYAKKGMLVGPPGSGKSRLVGTFPGKTMVFAFDPAAIDVYNDLDHVYIEEYPIDSIDLGVTAKRENAAIANKIGDKSPKAYTKFESDLRDFIGKSMWADFQNVVIDSATTLEAAERDYVMYVNNTFGHVPKLDDHNLTANQTLKLVRILTALPITTIFVVHDSLLQDTESKKFLNQLLLTGKSNRRHLPALFNHILRTEVDEAVMNGTKVTKYFLLTKSNKQNPYIRTSFKNLDAKIDVTIGDFLKPQDYGLGKIIKEQR
jgi:hypothetical protein